MNVVKNKLIIFWKMQLHLLPIVVYTPCKVLQTFGIPWILIGFYFLWGYDFFSHFMWYW